MAKILLPWVVCTLILSLMINWGFGDDLGLPLDENIEQQNYTKILNFWRNHRSEFVFHGDHKEVVLVMGNTGAGKTTLVSALIGRRLRVVKTKGYFMIVDEENRIGTGTSSKTLVPEVMIDFERNVTFIDCSGFRDNRDIEYEISSLYFQNILMNEIQKIKLILVVNYESLKVNGNKNDFDDLFKHVGEFVKNITKFHDSIALVAMKVESIYEQTDDGTFILSNDNQSVLNGIADFLKNKKEVYQNKTVNREKYRMFTNLIDVLLEKKNDSYARIAIFRQPTRIGLLADIPEKKNEINGIAGMIINNLGYVEKYKDDFGFALSTSSKTTVDQIVADIFRNALTNHLHKIGNETLMHYLQMEKQYTDITVLRREISQAYDRVSSIKKANKPEQLFEKLLDVANTLNISVSLSNVNAISDDIATLRFFTTVSNSNEDINMILLKRQMQTIIDSIDDLTNFYDFLNELNEKLATYKSQKLKNDQRIKKILVACSSSRIEVVRDISDLENLVKEISNDKIYQKIKTFKLNQSRLKYLKAIFSAFTIKPEFSCSSSSELLTVEGYNLMISDVMQIACWEQAQNIQIFALNKVFIDKTINKIGAQQLIIMAPTWEVVGGPQIILNGKEGEEHKEATAKSAFSNSEDGSNGLPGLPGGPAGNFFGVGKLFINSEYLTIRANGGNGGPGQHGGNGADGIPGEELSESFFDTNRSPGDIMQYFAEHGYVHSFKQLPLHCVMGIDGPICDTHTKFELDIFGKPAKKPTNGGNGGGSGKGGYPGRIVIYSLKDLVNVRTSNDSGFIGSEGKGGLGGKGTNEGRRVKCDYKYGYYIIPVNLEGKYSNIKWTDGAEVPAGKDGISGNNWNRQKDPTASSPMSLHSVINSFKDFLRKNLFENIKESELRTFVYEIENNNQIKTHYNTIAFVNELNKLENQFLELKNKIDFVPFYNSFLSRVEEYAKSERLLENKKVLGYTYTAALTNLFTLNKKRKDQTVVNLPKYLDSIEKNIKEIEKSYHLKIVQKYQDDYNKTLNQKIQEASDFIQNTIEPEIDQLWDETESQISAIIDEINQNRNSTKKTLESLEKDRVKIQKMMLLRGTLLPLKLSACFLSVSGPIGAIVGVAVTTSTTVAEGVLLDSTSSRGEYRIHSLDPNLRLVSRVTEVLNNRYHIASDKLTTAIAQLEKYEAELPLSEKDRTKKIKTLKNQLREAMAKKTTGFSQSAQKLVNIEKIAKKIVALTKSEKDLVTKKKEEEKKIHDLRNEVRYEKYLRLLNHAQSIMNSAETIYIFTRRLANDEGVIKKINNQMSENFQELIALEKMENQVYDIILPDLRHIEDTMNEAMSSVNGSSHAKLDLTKWNVRTTLRDVKLLLQKFTHKMSFEVQSNLQRFIDKIDEGFSILIDIYDRIDSYSDSVKQAEYIAHIESASMDNVQVTDVELTKAVNDLKLMIHSNILTEKYEIALHAFKQHYFPFAANTLKKFQLPVDMKLNDTDTLRSNIISKINEMKNYIATSDATIGEYSKYIHRKNTFNSNIVGSSPFYVWKHNTITNEIQQLLNGSEIMIKADISKGPFYNAVKYNDIGINFKFDNQTLQSNFTSVLENFRLTMTMIGNNYYRCGERYYFISFDDDITISYTLSQDGEKNWIDPNEVYTLIHSSHTFLSPYGMWSIKLQNISESVSFDHLNVFANKTIDLELVGQGYYIEQNTDFNFDVCSEYLDAFYDVENIVRVLF